MNDISKTIGYAHRSWNPLTGCWGPGGTQDKPNWCSYCYARRMAERFRGSKAWPQGFEPMYHEGRLFEPMKIKEPKRIFVCDMADLFGDWVPSVAIRNVLAITQQAIQHTYLFLTKNPARLPGFNPWPSNCWVGATATNSETYTDALVAFAGLKAGVRFISCEPLLGPIGKANLVWGGIQWIILGGLSGPGGSKSYPKAEWVEEIELAADTAEIAIWEKENLRALGPYRQELPKGG